MMGQSNELDAKNWFVESLGLLPLTTDPAYVKEGYMWYRQDLNQIKTMQNGLIKAVGGGGLDWKQSAQAATVANIADLLAGAPSVVDGVTLAVGSRILVKDQSTTKQNGIYDVVTVGTGSNGVWERSSDATQDSDLTTGAMIYIEAGSVNAKQLFVLTTPEPFSVGVDPIAFQLIPAFTLHDTSGLPDSLNKRYVTDAELAVLAATSGVNTGDQSLAALALKATTVNGHALSANVTLTTADIADSSNKRYVTDAELAVLAATSGVNTGDQDLSTYVQGTRTVNGHALSSNVTVTKSDVGLGSVANADTTTTANITDSSNKRFVTDAELAVLVLTSGTNTGDQDLSGLALKATTVNGHALSSNVTVSKSDVGLGNVDNLQQIPLSYLDTDGTLAGNSDSKVASQKAVKTYVDAHAGGGGSTWKKKAFADTGYTATAGDQIFIDTSGGAVTINLPASPASMDSVTFKSGATADSNNLTVAQNGHTIMAVAEDMTVSTANVQFTLVYDGTTWRL